jgi:hypothetical protein
MQSIAHHRILPSPFLSREEAAAINPTMLLSLAAAHGHPLLCAKFRKYPSKSKTQAAAALRAIRALCPDECRSGSKHHDRDDLDRWGGRSGSKTWRQGYGWEGVRQSFTIGCAARVQLADAGKIARQVQGWLKDGIDPHSRRSAGGACENGWKPIQFEGSLKAGFNTMGPPRALMMRVTSGLQLSNANQ